MGINNIFCSILHNSTYFAKRFVIDNFNITRQYLTINGIIQNLTHRESQVLLMLYENRNQVLERKQVLDKLWGDNNFFNARSMDVFITRLRKYLKNDSSVQILNIRGVGYKLTL